MKAEEEIESKSINRRKFLALPAAAAMGAALASLPKTALAATNDSLIIGQINEADEGYSTVLETSITGTPDPEKYGIGLYVINQGGYDPRTIAIRGEAPNGAGVYGRGGMDGVVGNGDICGVVGKSEGIGVFGISPAGVGVRAESPEGMALQVLGRSSFSTMGIGEVVRGQDSAWVDDPSVTKESHIMVTLTSDPKSEAAVSWVNRKKGLGFTVHLTHAVVKRTDFTYFIVEPIVEPV